jgi:hypothetical protein
MHRNIFVWEPEIAERLPEIVVSNLLET